MRDGELTAPKAAVACCGGHAFDYAWRDGRWHNVLLARKEGCCRIHRPSFAELARRVCPCSGLVRFGALVVADDAVERAAARIRERATIALDVPQPGSHLTDAAIDCAELEIGLHAEDALRRARNRIAEIGICRLEASIDCLAQWAGRGDCEPLKTVRTSLGREHDGGLG